MTGACIIGILGKIFLQHLPVENVDTHRCFVALGLLGLFLKFDYPAVVVGIHNAEARSLLDGNGQNCYGGIRSLFLVEGEHL